VRYLINLSLLMGIAEVAWQMTSYTKFFEVGSLHLIHGRTTISPADRDIPGRQHGLSEAARSRNGSHPVQVLFYGFMENVSSPTLYAFAGTDRFTFR
jgi:hypothetical protein